MHDPRLEVGLSHTSEDPSVMVPDLEAFKSGLTAREKYQLVILYALNKKAGEIYAGTVTWREIQKRRRRNKQQRMSRRANR